ncbi:hypothetical protein D3C80_726890 [compost metagenome]
MPFRARQLQKATGKHADDGAHDEPPQRKHRRLPHDRGEGIPAENRRHQQTRREDDGERPFLHHEHHETEKQDDRGELVQQVGPLRHRGALIGR